MLRNMYKIAGRTDWKVLEDFYKDLGNEGMEKVEKMKRFRDAKYDVNADEPGSAYDMRYAAVNWEFLIDRYVVQGLKFVWTDENLDKLILLDQHIRKLEYEMYQKFIEIKQNLDGLIAQGFDVYKDYQVTGEIRYDVTYIDDDEHKRKYDWICELLQGYVDMRALKNFSFGDGQEPEDPRNSENYIFKGKRGKCQRRSEWLNYDYFVKNGMTAFLYHLMVDLSHSLYSYNDIVNMNLKCFYINYDISFSKG